MQIKSKEEGTAHNASTLKRLLEENNVHSFIHPCIEQIYFDTCPHTTHY
jgi:hypothetical protein